MQYYDKIKQKNQFLNTIKSSKSVHYQQQQD